MHAIGDHLTPLDSTFLELEQADEGAMMHIGGALIFDRQMETGGTPSFEQLSTLLDERLGTLPRFRCRLSEPRVHGLGRPYWVEDPSVSSARRFELAAVVDRGSRWRAPAPRDSPERTA